MVKRHTMSPSIKDVSKLVNIRYKFSLDLKLTIISPIFYPEIFL